MSNLSIRHIASDEAEILTDIHKKCFPRYWNREAFTDFFSVENTFASLAENEIKPIGMMVYRVACEQADILTLAVLPEYRRQGIAKILLAQMLENCQKLGVMAIFLEVEVGNDAAIKLYQDNGFKYINRRKLYYQQPDGTFTDGLMMGKKLQDRS